MELWQLKRARRGKVLIIIIIHITQPSAKYVYLILRKFRVFWKNGHFRGNFHNSVPKVFIATSNDNDVLCSNFVKFGRREIGKVVRYLPGEKNFAWLSCSRSARIAPKICWGQPQTMYSECSRFNPNRFTFSGVIAQRVNTVKTRRQVFPIFGWSLAWSRILIVDTYKPNKAASAMMLMLS